MENQRADPICNFKEFLSFCTVLPSKPKEAHIYNVFGLDIFMGITTMGVESWKYCCQLAPVNIDLAADAFLPYLSRQKPFFSGQSEGIDLKSLTLFVTSLKSRVSCRCQSTTQILYWNYVVLPRRSAGLCP